MLLYRGDKFVKDKKFTINEQVYRFVKRDNDNRLIFENLKDNTKLVLDEDYINDSMNKGELTPEKLAVVPNRDEQIKRYRKMYRKYPNVYIPGEGKGKVVNYNPRENEYGTIDVKMENSDDIITLRLGLDEVEILKEEVCLFDNKTTKLK